MLKAEAEELLTRIP